MLIPPGELSLSQVFFLLHSEAPGEVWGHVCLAGSTQSFANTSYSALLPEKLHDLMKKKVFEASFPLHEVRPSAVCWRKSHQWWRSKAGEAFGNWVFIKTSLDEGHDKAPNSSLGDNLVLVIPCPTVFSACRKKR